MNNIFENIPFPLPEELMETLQEDRGCKIERIVSRGHATPPGQWYDQESGEWVILLKGSAGLRIEGQEEVLVLNTGDYAYLPAHQKHRVEWTLQNADTLWLAVYF